MFASKFRFSIDKSPLTNSPDIKDVREYVVIQGTVAIKREQEEPMISSSVASNQCSFRISARSS